MSKCFATSETSAPHCRTFDSRIRSVMQLAVISSALLEGDTGDTIDPSVFAGMPNLEPVDAPMQGPRTPPRESPSLFCLKRVG